MTVMRETASHDFILDYDFLMPDQRKNLNGQTLPNGHDRITSRAVSATIHFSGIHLMQMKLSSR
jgi:hypothetical protein